MHSFVRITLLAGASLLAAPAFADTGTNDQDTQSSAGTGASDAEPEIVVTARHRRETSQEVPLAISVVQGDHIDNTGAFNVGRLTQLTPTVQFASSNPRNSSVNIRGIGSPLGLTNDGIEQGVGIYIDDVYSSRVASATFDFLDVDRIEILRGPQGTLYGKNTTAGAIVINTRQPTFTFEGRAELSLGNLGFKQAKAAVSGPLSDKLAARLALSTTSRRGTIYNVITGNWVNEQDNLGLRLQLLWRPTDNLDVTFSGDYNTQNPECCATVYVRTGTTQRPIYRQFDALAAAQGYSVVSRDPFARITDVDADLNAGNQIGGLSLRAKLDLGDTTLTSVTGWRFWDWKPSNDRDFTGLPITTKSQNPSQQNQYTQEFRLSHSGRRIDFTAGLFGYYQTIRTQGLQQLGPAASRWLLNPGNITATYQTNPAACATVTTRACNPAVLNGLTSSNDIRLDSASVAFYGQAAVKLTDRFTIQPGIRVNYDSKKGYYNAVVTDSAGNLVTFSPTNTPTQIDQLSQMAPEFFEPRYSAWNVSADLTARYDLADDVHLYGTYARTFKSGGINLNGVPAAADGTPLLQFASVKPERVNHYEAGLKTQFAGRSVTINLAVFRTDIGNYQAVVNNGAVSALRGYVDNAESVRSQGFEWDASWRPSRRFNLYLNGAYTDAKYRRFTNAPCPPELSGGGSGTPIGAAGSPGANSPVTCDISGQVLPGVSRWSLSYGAEGNVPAGLFGKEGEVYL
ncbi:MAG: TonB-dependent receptor, partial [Novosphingobium sp.]|uniref:TonB-dependent receptor n=1 Tax=Novosphingobium sp. TaxID=1874826 RepID=UPI003C7B05AD